MSNTDRSISYFTDQHGNYCARIPLPNTDSQMICDFEMLETWHEAGMPFNWYANSNGTGTPYVKITLPGGQKFVFARFVIGAGSGQQVGYRNHNPLDVRLTNLFIRRGGRAYRDCSMLPTAVDLESDWEFGA